jgi:uncharacterized cupin superfamily protein
MSTPTVGPIPLLGRSIGSKDTDLAVYEIEDPGRPAGTDPHGIPLHRHRTEDEAWYVLRGTLRFQFGDREFDATAGDGVLLPHGIPHTFWNPGPGSARYLLIVRPRTAALLGALHGTEPPDRSKLHELYSKFEADLLE